MDKTNLNQQLQQLTDKDLQALLDGASLIMVDDLSIEVVVDVDTGQQAVIYSRESATKPPTDRAGLKDYLQAQCHILLENFYLYNPLSQHGFNHQLETLAAEYGCAAFSALPGNTPEYTLFVDGGKVIAEPRGSARHPYGTFLELEKPIHGDELEQVFADWLRSSLAYEHYLSMNTCRYNC